MSDIETESSEAPHFTQTGSLSDPSLGQLREQIKKVMIPLLIKTFQFKLELNQSLSLPSRLQSPKNQHSPDEIREQLKTLDNDLKMLLLWCQSCRSQIYKALTVPEEEQKNTVTAPPPSAPPSVAKSFNEAVSAQSSFFQQQLANEKKAPPFPYTAGSNAQKTWWEKLLGTPDSE
jgi:hypothetical protein